MKVRLRAVAASGLLAWLFLLAAPAASQDQGLPLEPARTLDYEVGTGTFMSLTVSPDGRTILFDMLGELYAVSARGGRARPIATGLAFDSQPTFSPDGKWIAFVSDRSGVVELKSPGADVDLSPG